MCDDACCNKVRKYSTCIEKKQKLADKKLYKMKSNESNIFRHSRKGDIRNYYEIIRYCILSL